jgi:hypothetical protein
MWKKALILLFEVGFGITFNLIGTISLSELFLLFTSFLFVKKRLFSIYPELRKLAFLYIGLLSAQIISEIIVGNELNNALKGIAVTIVSFFHFIFLFRFFIQDRKYIVYALAGFIIRALLFSKEEGTIEEVISGENAYFLKFYLVNLITNPLLILSVFAIRKKRMSLVIIFVGSLLVILGARSSGLGFILTGSIAYLVLKYKTINRKQFIKISVIVAIVGYGLYTIYVNQVLLGKITSGNSWQITLMENPYNPMGLLMMGRTEIFVGWEAFMDEFLFGHGAWAVDRVGKYNALMFVFRNNESADINSNIIPAHSVLIGSGMYNGIFAFLFMFMILYFILKKGFIAISNKDPYLIVIISFIISILWHGLFSPTSHFRSSFPLYFAAILASYLIKNTSNEK